MKKEKTCTEGLQVFQFKLEAPLWLYKGAR
jgi:hypothetical protein